jgi:hypothetical protein
MNLIQWVIFNPTIWYSTNPYDADILYEALWHKNAHIYYL